MLSPLTYKGKLISGESQVSRSGLIELTKQAHLIEEIRHACMGAVCFGRKGLDKRHLRKLPRHSPALFPQAIRGS